MTTTTTTTTTYTFTKRDGSVRTLTGRIAPNPMNWSKATASACINIELVEGGFRTIRKASILSTKQEG